MAIGLKPAYAALKALIEADTGVQGWATTHFAKPLVVLGGIHAGPARDDQKPAALIELDESDETRVTLAAGRTRVATGFEVSIAWNEANHAQVHDQRLEIPDLFAEMLLKNHTLAGTVYWATVTRWFWEDSEENEFIFVARVGIEYDIVKP